MEMLNRKERIEISKEEREIIDNALDAYIEVLRYNLNELDDLHFINIDVITEVKNKICSLIRQVYNIKYQLRDIHSSKRSSEYEEICEDGDVPF